MERLSAHNRTSPHLPLPHSLSSPFFLQSRKQARRLHILWSRANKGGKMKKRQQEDESAPSCTASSSSSSLVAPPTRRSISMGDFRRAQPGSETPSAPATAPSSKLVTPSSSMEFEAARRRLLEVEERRRVIQEMERRLEELREVFVRSERQAAEHGELVARVATTAQQGELYVAENSQRLKKGLRFKRHRPTIIFSSMLGLRTCLPWPVKLK